ncbi:MAG: omptin family outer membrane protease [Kiritimatiellae bacterium]|nr:omptin family outer membrane protease [Kiritimatiellia bacterium]
MRANRTARGATPRAAARLCAALTVCGLAAESCPAQGDSEQDAAVAPAWRVEAGLCRLSGHSTYEVGASGWWPLSRLEFPLETDMALLGLGGRFHRFWTFGAELAASISRDAGTMRDWDWLSEDVPGRLDLYSESDAELAAFTLEFVCRRALRRHEAWTVCGGLGYLYQSFGWRCTDVHQWSPSGLAGFDYEGTPEETALTYDARYHIPYLEATAAFRRARLALEAGAAYAPLVLAEDEDDHRLRGILCRTDARGVALRGRLNARVRLTEHLFLFAGLDALFIATGQAPSRCAVYAADDQTLPQEAWRIAHRLDSTQGRATAGLSAVF